MNTLHRVLLAAALSTLAYDATGGRRIINGEKAEKNSLQYMVSVQANGKHICGGFLISEDYVLTAAHCDEGRPMSVVLGTHNLKLTPITRTVAHKIKHKLYRKPKLGNDIMLLKLSKNNAMSSEDVTSISIPKKDKPVNPDTKCMVAGWGRTETRDNLMDLMVTNVSTITFQDCQSEWSSVNTELPENVLCAGGFEKSGACTYDSGGPLVCGSVAVGIVSFNYNEDCKYPNAPNVYTQISKYLTWIKKAKKTA